MINAAFVTDVTEASGGYPTELEPFPEFQASASGSGDAPAQQAASKAAHQSFEDMNDPRTIFHDRGFSVGERVKEKGVDGEVFAIDALITDPPGSVRLSEVNWAVDPDSAIKVVLPLLTLLKSWSIHKHPLTEVVKSNMSVTEHWASHELLRTTVFTALHAQETSNGMLSRPLIFLRSPAGVAASQPIQKGVLKLAPLAGVANIHIDKPGGQPVQATADSQSVWITGPPKTTREDDVAKATYIPFWWVEVVSDESKANMKYAKVSVAGSGVSFPVLQNYRAVAKNERLCIYKPKEVKTALQGAEVIRPTPPASGKRGTSGTQESSGSTGTGAKKPKK